MMIDILTLFPEMFTGPFSSSILKRAQERNCLQIDLINIRDFSTNKHHTVDDTPYGGGAGMLLGPEPFFRAVEHLAALRDGRSPKRILLLCPQGRPFTQAIARELAAEENLVFICGHYEGIDERVRENLVTDEISIGDYILTGGELPAMVVVDAVARLLPGVLGEAASTEEESFNDGLLEYPQYTRPGNYQGFCVPEVLLSGHHERIRLWRRRQALLRTLANRPEMMGQAVLNQEDKEIIKSIMLDLQKLT